VKHFKIDLLFVISNFRLAFFGSNPEAYVDLPYAFSGPKCPINDDL
jgi:hypothetical protein